jgi:putative OPT family oligopeptide transporter
MIIDQKELRFPEGVACAEVLKAGDRGGAEMFGIFAALGVGAVFKTLVEVVGLFKGKVEWSTRLGNTGFYMGTSISPMLMAVGFIVGWEISLLIFLGGAISFAGAIPVLAYGVDLGTGDPTEVLMGIWDEQIRYFGIGAMLVAGIYSILKILGSIGAAVRTAIGGITGIETGADLPRTEQGITGKTLFLLMAMCLVLSGAVYAIMTKSVPATVATTVAMFVLAFFFVAVASYIVGLVGSSNSPVSGMTICTVLITAGLLLVLGYTGPAGMLATLGVAGVVCCAACTSGDICQDLKIGQIVGATPRRLQTGELIGTMLPAFIIAPTMQLLQNAYGIGQAAREGIDPLAAPQGVMFQKLVGSIFDAERALPWNLVGWGAAVAVVAILIDRFVLQPRQTKFRLHAMPLAVGMYLPWTVTFPILIGGFVYKIVERWSERRGDTPQVRQSVIHRGLLFCSGLVAGEAIMGIVIAVLVLTNLPLPIFSGWVSGRGWVDAVSLLGLLVVIVMLMHKSLHKRTDAAA